MTATLVGAHKYVLGLQRAGGTKFLVNAQRGRAEFDVTENERVRSAISADGRPATTPIGVYDSAVHTFSCDWDAESQLFFRGMSGSGETVTVTAEPDGSGDGSDDLTFTAIMIVHADLDPRVGVRYQGTLIATSRIARA